MSDNSKRYLVLGKDGERLAFVEDLGQGFDGFLEGNIYLTLAELDDYSLDLRGFAQAVLSSVIADGIELDGFDIQELAEKHGLIKERTVQEPCNNGNEYQRCGCAEVGEFPQQCYRFQF